MIKKIVRCTSLGAAVAMSMVAIDRAATAFDEGGPIAIIKPLCVDSGACKDFGGDEGCSRAEHIKTGKCTCKENLGNGTDVYYCFYKE